MNPGGGAPPGGKPAGGKPGGAPPGKPAGGKPGNPGGGAPLPGKPGGPPPGAPGNPPKDGGGAAPPPTPAAGPAREIAGAAPRPAARATPGPAVRVDMPPPPVLPRRALGSAGGGDSTDKDTIWAPRTMVRPSVLFSSCSTVWLADEPAPGADFAWRRLMRRNSSVSARTRFMCLSKASICPVIWRPSLRVTRIR